MSELSIDTQNIDASVQTFNTNRARALRKNLEIIGWLVVAALIAVGLTSVIGRGIFVLEALAEPDPEAVFNAFDIRYLEHYIATILHLIPALLIVFIGPLQFISAIRNRYRTFHRWSGRIFLVCGAVGAATGFFIGAIYPFMGVDGQGFNESMATTAIALYTWFCLYKAYTSIRMRRIGKHREWMIRSWSIMLGIATERVILGIFMASTDIGMGVLFGATFWMAAAINISVAEYWIHLTRTPGNGARHWKMIDAQSKVAA